MVFHTQRRTLFFNLNKETMIMVLNDFNEFFKGDDNTSNKLAIDANLRNLIIQAIAPFFQKDSIPDNWTESESEKMDFMVPDLDRDYQLLKTDKSYDDFFPEEVGLIATGLGLMLITPADSTTEIREFARKFFDAIDTLSNGEFYRDMIENYHVILSELAIFKPRKPQFLELTEDYHEIVSSRLNETIAVCNV